jgi:hypothetical protein
MSDYRERANEYKAKRIGQVDAKVVAPKGRKKKVDKPWCVTLTYQSFPQWKPWAHYFAKEHDARAFYRKQQNSRYCTAVLTFNGEIAK